MICHGISTVKLGVWPRFGPGVWSSSKLNEREDQVAKVESVIIVCKRNLLGREE